MKTRDEFNILFTSAGRRVSIVQLFQKTLTELGLKGKVGTTDIKKNAPATFIADFREQVPLVTDKHYIETLKGICNHYEIKLVIPLIDTELPVLAAHREDFTKMGVNLLVSSPEVIDIAFDKRKTFRFLKRIGVATPNILNPEEILNDPFASYPFLIKPYDGSSSIGVMKINDHKELAFFKDYIPNAIVQEYVTGEEYTLDVLVDFQGNVRSLVPRLRIETRAGEISKGVTVKNQTIITAGKKVVESLPGAVGCITVQCFLTKYGDIKFIEINPRFGGGYPLSAAAGANFPRWIIEMTLGKDPIIAIDEWQDGLMMLRYDEAIFVAKDMTA